MGRKKYMITTRPSLRHRDIFDGGLTCLIVGRRERH